MLRHMDSRRFALRVVGLLAAAVFVFPGAPASAQSGDPIKIGYAISLTGPVAPFAKSMLLAHQIWQDDINAKGGLLGRPVKLVYYDNQSNPATVPGIYTKLLDADKVDLIIGPFGTNLVTPAVPVAMQKNKTLVGLFALAVNSEFKYPRYFSMTPNGPNPKVAISKGFFDLAMEQDPKPRTVAIVAADAEFGRNASDGARENANNAGLKIVYDKFYPPNATDFAPIVRAIQATNPDVVMICSYPADSVGMVRAVNEIGYKPKMIGGAMILQTAALMTQLGPLLNGFTIVDFWVPTPKLEFPGTADFLEKYQSRALTEGVDPLGYWAPFAYAQLEIMGQAVRATTSLDDDKLAEYIRGTTFKTVVGDVKFGPLGEWEKSRLLLVQFQGIKDNNVAQFKNNSTQVVLTPAEFRSGDMIYPYEKAK
jgi:branched-chain amino acid transport system substrate-binding protein